MRYAAFSTGPLKNPEFYPPVFMVNIMKIPPPWIMYAEIPHSIQHEESTLLRTRPQNG